MFSDCLDTYFKYVKARIISKNPNRKIVGMVEAQAWPVVNVVDEAFYLLIQNETTPRNFGTVSSRGIVHSVQWVWVVIGVDLPQSGVIGKNRGTRYRNNAQMKSEILYSQFPSFCPKNTYSPQQQGSSVTLIPSLTGESIWWSSPQFLPSKMESTSGVLYGAAKVQVSEFSDLITS